MKKILIVNGSKRMKRHPSSGTKAFLISFPSSPRMGMFCRFGSLEESRPVAVTHWLNDVCICPVLGLMSFGSASI